MKDDLISKVMDEVMKKLDGSAASAAASSTSTQSAENILAEVMKKIEASAGTAAAKPQPVEAVPAPAAPVAASEPVAPAPVVPADSQAKGCNLTEFVGTAIGHTIGLVIANVDYQIHEKFEIDSRFRAIGMVGGRMGASPHIFAADEAVKATNSEVLRIELSRDTEGGAGHGCLIIFGAEDVSDVRRAVEVCLHEVDRTFGDVYRTSAGHLEFQYTARASSALNKAYGAPIGKSFGITTGAPAAIGVVLADTAVKSSPVDVVGIATPGNGKSSFTNEVTLFFSGDSGAVKQAVINARDVGMDLLKALTPDEELKSSTTPYIL